MKLMRTLGRLAIALGLVVLAGADANAQTAPTLTATANGLQVTINWTDVPGATAYLLEAGTTSGGSQIATVPVVTRPVVVNPVPPGTYFLRVRAIIGAIPGAASNEVALTVTPPGCNTVAAPTLASSVNGPAVTLAWNNVSANDYVLQFGLSSGRTDLAQQVSSTVNSFTQSVPITGTFVARVVARNACGQTATSNEVTFTIANLCATQNPVLNVSVQGGTATFTWTGVASATALAIELSRHTQGAELVDPPFSGAATSYPRYIPLLGNFFARLAVTTACGTTRSAFVPFSITDLSIGGGPRTPDPAPGTIIPRSTIQYGRDVVIDASARFAGDLLHSCREHGGNNVWMFRVLQELRRRDSRWGLNYKRGNVGDLSQDIVTYNGTSGPDVTATQIYLYDIIGNHCPSSGAPTWNWGDATDASWEAGRQGLCAPGNRYCALWTVEPYLRAGFPPDGQ